MDFCKRRLKSRLKKKRLENEMKFINLTIMRLIKLDIVDPM